MITRKKISQNLHLSIADRRYKLDKLSVELTSPLTRQNVTYKALLPMVMSHATSSFGDIVAISRELDRLYGASLFSSAATYGGRSVLKFDISEARDSFLPNSRNGIEAAKLLLEVVLAPRTQNGVFLNSAVNIEREKLREQIISEINNKRSYCLKLLNKEFFKDDVRSYPSSGFEEDLDDITPADLYSAYIDLLSQSSVEVFYAGEHPQEIENMLIDAFAGKLGQAVTQKLYPALLPSEPFEIVERVNVEQDKLALLYHSGQLASVEDAAALRVANTILGSAPTSRLFMNVREKLSLCYNCSSHRSISSGSAITIDSGVSAANAALAKAAIMNEFESLATNGPTDKELDEVKLYLINLIRGISDSVSDYGAYTLSNIRSFSKPFSQAEEIALVESVSRNDVKKILGSMTYCGSCRLTGKSND